MGEKVTITQ